MTVGREVSSRRVSTKCSRTVFYYVFLDPQTVREASKLDGAGLSLLLSIWRGLSVNCCLCEVDGYLIEQGLGVALREISDQGEGVHLDHVSRLKKLLVYFKKQNRFIDILSTSEADQDLSDIAFADASEVGIDFILTEKPAPAGFTGSEVGGLSEYAVSDFERERAKNVDDGLIPEGEDTADEFFPRKFGKLVRFAQKITIIDAILGRKFGDNFQYTLKRLICFLEEQNVHPEELAIEIHTEEERSQYLKDRLQEWCTIVNPSVITHASLHHERYFFTDQFGLKLGIGCDLLDRRTQRNRGTDFSYSRPSNKSRILTR